MSSLDVISAVEWKKYDSKTFSDEYPGVRYKKVSYYQSYIKGNNNMYVNIYSHSKNGGKKLSDKIIFTKNNNIIKVSRKNYFSNEKETNYYQTKWSLKKFYKGLMKFGINDCKIHIEKQA